MKEICNRIFADASKYSLGAESLSKGNDVKLHLPAVLCASFAIELLLKCIILLQEEESGEVTKNIHKHEFFKLFEMINPENQDIIVKQYRKILNGTQISLSKFKNLLRDNGNNAFVEWRYSFEKNMEERNRMRIDQKIFADITNALGKSIEIIRPDI